MSQTDRLIAWLRANPGATSLEITQALAVVNVTGRISDARKEGHVIDCARMEGGRFRYWLREAYDGTLRLVS